MPFGHIHTETIRATHESINRDSLLKQLESVYHTLTKETALRNDDEADAIGDAAIDELDPATMRKVVRSWLRGDGVDAFNIVCGCLTRGYEKHVERQAEQALDDVVEQEVRDRADKMDRRI